MGLDGQLEKLGALYADKSDGELQDLYERREGLTELAQQALAGVMRERGLGAREVSGRLSGRQTATAEAGRDGSGDAGEDVVGEDEVLAYMFHDAFEAREAIRTMTEAGIRHRMLDWHVVNPEMEVSQTGVDLGLVVERSSGQRTLVVLKDKLGLFPAPEDVTPEGREALVVLSMFERGDALAAARALGLTGMTYLWRDGRDHVGELPDEETVAIEVRAADVERATGVIEEALAELPEEDR